MIIVDRSYDSDKVINNIKKYPVVSFDIFDTLVIRSFDQPRDLFYRVAEEYNRLHKSEKIDTEKFHNARILAASIAKRKAHQDGREETNLAEIYDSITDDYLPISGELLSIEEEREIDCCYPNPLIKRVYNYCVEEKKVIFFTSDMYLPKEIIEKILSKCGYSKYQLLLSSDQNAKKANGKLFDILLAKAGVENRKVVHIGDHYKNDYYQAKQHKMNAVLIPQNCDNRSYKRNSPIPHNLRKQYRVIQKITGKHIDPLQNQYYKYGFEVVGILLYGFTTWLYNEISKNSYSNIFFLSRDGFLMQKAYSILFDTYGKTGQYFYVSRKSLRSPQFWMNPTLDDIMEQETSFHYWSLSELCEMLCLDEEEARQVWINCGLKTDERLIKKELLSDERVKCFFDCIKDKIIESSYKKFDDVKTYMEQENFTGNVAIVDVGWAGAIQKYLNRIVQNSDQNNTSIFGYYLGLKPKTVMGTNFSSYIPQEEHPSLFCSHLMEYPFTKMTGSTLTYKRMGDGTINPVLSEYEFKNTKDEYITAEMQKGITDFIQIMKNGYYPQSIDYRIAYSKIKRITKSPSLHEVESLKDLTHVNHGLTYYLANPKSVIHYLTHFHEFKLDFSNSGWKIGFLKKLCKIPLPYSYLLEKARNANGD